MGILKDAQQDPFPDLTITHGPSDLLVDFFETAVRAANARGVRLMQGTFQQLQAINRVNQETWFPLFPTYDPDIGGADEDNGICLFGHNGDGDVVATQAVRIFDCRNSTFADEAATLRMFYADPQRQRQPDETCSATTPACNISGRIALCGAVWYRPDFRGRGLSAILPRLARAYAFVRWRSNVTAALMDEAVVRGGITNNNGYTHTARSLIWRNSPRGDRRFVFAWMVTAEMLDDMAGFLSGFAADLDAGIQKRRA
jgi:hypothetical protein